MNSYKYDPDINDDFKKVDVRDLKSMVRNVWHMVGYNYLKIEAEEGLKWAVVWVKDFYENSTSEYEEALYDFERTYITTSEQTD